MYAFIITNCLKFKCERRPEGPKGGPKDQKEAQRTIRRPEGPKRGPKAQRRPKGGPKGLRLEVGLRRGPRLLVSGFWFLELVSGKISHESCNYQIFDLGDIY